MFSPVSEYLLSVKCILLWEGIWNELRVLSHTTTDLPTVKGDVDSTRVEYSGYVSTYKLLRLGRRTYDATTSRLFLTASWGIINCTISD
jgi:hypothetical protein